MFYLIEESVLFDILPANNDMTLRIESPIDENAFNDECKKWGITDKFITGVGIRRSIVEKIKKFTNTIIPIQDIADLFINEEDRIYIIRNKVTDIRIQEFVPIQLTSKFLFDHSKDYTFHQLFNWLDGLYEKFKCILPYFESPTDPDCSWAITMDKSNPNHDKIQFRYIYDDEVLTERQGEPVMEITKYVESVSIAVYNDDNEEISWNWQFLQHPDNVVVSSDLLDSLRGANTGNGMDLMYFLQDLGNVEELKS